MSTTELKHLLQVLQERNIALSQDDVAWAFNGAETGDQARHWVNEHLSPANLLTKEELNFYETHGISNSRISRQAGKPLADADVEAAIECLEASSRAIDKQCQLLEAQKQSLMAMKSRHANNDDFERVQAQRASKTASEQAQLDLEISELSHSLQSRLRASRTQTDAAAEGLPSGIERVLDKDDRLLDGLGKLLLKLDTSGQHQIVPGEVDGLCQALARLSGRAIRSKLDAAYRSGIPEMIPVKSGSDEQISSQATTLRAELDELTGEIDGLITMMIDSQHRTPILKGLQAEQSEAEHEKTQWTAYLAQTLQYLISRLEKLAEHTDHLHAHQSALQHISVAMESVTATSKPKQDAATLSPSTPRANSQKGLKPLRLVQANLSEPQDPTAQLLRHFDIRDVDGSDPRKLADVLSQTRTERRKALAQLSVSTERHVADLMGETLSKADRDVQDLLGAVYAASKFGSVRLVDDEAQEGLLGLEERTRAMGDEMRALDIDGIVKMICLKQEAVVHGR